MPYIAAAVLVAVLGLQAGARIASQDSHALAIMWGAPATRGETVDFRALYRESKEPKAAKGRDTLKPRVYARLAGGAVVRDRDVDEWLRAMNRWTHKETPLLREAWESRQDWRAMPLFSQIGGPFDFYTMVKQPW